MSKENDFLVASVNNQGYSPEDFGTIGGMTLDNTQFLSKDEYLKTDYVKQNDAFKNDNGEFDNDKFNEFYDKTADNFRVFAAEDIINQPEIPDTSYAYGFWDVLAPTGAKVRQPVYYVTKVANPDHNTIGITGVNTLGYSKKSKRELAQDGGIYNPATGKWEDKTVNDLALFTSPSSYFANLGSDPLVYATYDQDTTETDPLTGREVQHYKGEFKVHDGEYYVERLAGRSIRDKQVVPALDYITSEYSPMQKYDFLDSDQLEKSVGGTIANTLVTIAPLLIPYVGKVYAAALITRELAKGVPMLEEMINTATGEQSFASPLSNTIAAYAETFTGSVSDYSQQSTFTFENIGRLASEVANQWAQQKLIIGGVQALTGGSKAAYKAAQLKALNKYTKESEKAFNLAFEGKMSGETLSRTVGTSDPSYFRNTLIKGGKWAETGYGKAALESYTVPLQAQLQKRARIGQDLSLMYMSLISNTDVYDQVLQHGGTREEGALIALGSMIGMYGVDRYLHLGEVFFEQDVARAGIRAAAKKSADELIKTMGVGRVTAGSSKGQMLSLMERGMQAGKKAVSNYYENLKNHTLGFFGKALGEGLEETAEELVMDSAKAIGEIAGHFGYASQTDYGAFENAFDRYLMSFFGGAMGGAMFYGIDIYNNRGQQSKIQDDLVYQLRQGNKDKILNEVDRLYKNGKLGSKTLSMRTQSEDGKTAYLTAENEKDSQAYYTKQILHKTIDQLDFILNENGLRKSDPDLFGQLVKSDYRAGALHDLLTSPGMESASYVTKYYEDFQDITNKIVNKSLEIEQLNQQTPDPQKRTDLFKQKIKNLENQKEELVKQKDYLFGEGRLGYVEKMLFAMNPLLSSRFMPMTYNQYVRNVLGKPIEQLTETEQTKTKQAWEAYKSKQQSRDLDTAFKLFKDMEKVVDPSVQKTRSDLTGWWDHADKFVENLTTVEDVTYDTRLENESDDEYNNRNQKLENETDEQFKERVENRQQALGQVQEKRLADWIDKVSNGQFDKNQFAIVQQLALDRFRDRVNRLVWLTHKSKQIDGVSSAIIVEIGKVISDGIAKGDAKATILNNIQQTLNSIFEREYFDKFDFNSNQDLYLALINLINNTMATGNETADIDVVSLNYQQFKAWLDQLNTNDKEEFIEGLLDPKSEVIQAIKQKIKEINQDGFYDIRTLTKERLQKIFGKFVEWTKSSDQDDADTPLFITQGLFNQLVKDSTNNAVDQYEIILEEAVDKADKDQLLKSLQKLRNAQYTHNPIYTIMSAISKISPNKASDVETTLSNIYERWDKEDVATDFILTAQEKEILKQFIEDLGMFKAYVHAAVTLPSIQSPIQMNKTINAFVAANKGKFGNTTELPELDEKYVMFLENEANLFEKEVQNWLNISGHNEDNSIQKYIDAKNNYIKTVNGFYKINRNAFKIDDDTDLLDGYEGIADKDTELEFAQIEQLMHDNFKAAIEGGKTVEEILGILLPKVLHTDKLANQELTKLNQDISYESLTDYTKMQIILTNFALSPKKFYQTLHSTIQGGGISTPIHAQEIALKMTLAQQENPELINKALQFLVQKYNIKKPILLNFAACDGIGGAGKTSVETKLSLDGDVWVSGPVQSQVDNLLNQVKPTGKIEGRTKVELMQAALGSNYSKFYASYSRGKDGDYTTDGSFFAVKKEGNGIYIQLKNDVKVETLQNAPKIIIIDESTHFNTAELLVLSKFAQQNNIQILALGDSHQNGEYKPGLMVNLDTQVVFAWRTPQLFTSLRATNVQMRQNLNFFVNQIDHLEQAYTIGTDQVKDENTKIVFDLIKSGAFKFRYNIKKDFYGHLIAKELTESIIGKMSGTIGFIGSSTSSEYQKLKNAGKNVIQVDPLNVQGQEFDYVVVDRDISINGGRNNPSINDLELFLKDVYTMASRARNGCVFINHGDLNIFQCTEDEQTGVVNFSTVFQKWREIRVPDIKMLAETLTEKTIKKEQKNEDNELENEPGEEPENDPGEEPENEIVNINFPVRVYGNVNLSGIPIESGKNWTNKNGTKRDLGIFIDQNDEISTKEEKDKIVRWVFDVKSMFLYGVDNYDNLHTEIQQKFSKKAFEDAEYYIDVADDNGSSLIGLTNLDNNKRTIGNNKVVTLIAKFKDNSGIEYEITLGAFANPNTWESQKDNIKGALQQRIDSGDLNSKALREYINKLDDNIIAYKNKIAEITKKNQQMRINKPEISIGTTLVNSSNGLWLRLDKIHAPEDVTDDQKEATVSRTLRGANPYAVISKPQIITDTLDINAGHVVVFASSNTLLKAENLKDIYEKEKSSSGMHQVRMIVLSELGVSFGTLPRTRQLKEKMKFPFTKRIVGARLYCALWNFRADLQVFVNAVNGFKSQNKLTDNDINKICEEDANLYQSYEKKDGKLTEKAYRDRVRSDKNVADDLKRKLETLWAFNDKLSSADIRRFRLGYSNIDNTGGILLRNLTNLNKDGIYKKYLDDGKNVVGMYINWMVANEYLNALNGIFDECLNKHITPPSDIETTDRIQRAKDWVNTLDATNNLHLVVNGNAVKLAAKDKDKFSDVLEDLILLRDGKYSDYDNLVIGRGFFNYVFHGFSNTSYYNDFTNNDIRATDAEFKYGIIISTNIVNKGNNTGLADVLNIEGVGMYLGTKKVPGFPIINVSMEENKTPVEQPIVPQNNGLTQEEKNNIYNSLPENIKAFVPQNECTEKILRDIRDNKYSSLKTLIKNKVKKAWQNSNISSTEILQMPVKIETKNGRIVMTTLSDEFVKNGIDTNGVAFEVDNNARIAKIDDSKQVVVHVDNGVLLFRLDAVPNQLESATGNTIIEKVNEILSDNGIADMQELVGEIIESSVDDMDSELTIQEIKNIINKIYNTLDNYNVNNDVLSKINELKNIC